VFVDCDLVTRNLDIDQVRASITPRTRAIMPTHFAGLPVDIDGLYAVAHQHGLRVIEDAALAIGSRWRGRRIGAFGDLVVFSFHPNKNMTTIEGGALVLDDPDEARNADLHRFHGIRRNAEGEIDIEMPGGKYNFSDVSAVIGLAQLAQLGDFNARRRELAARYFAHLDTTPAMLLPDASDDGHAWHIFSPLLPLERMSITRAEFIRRMHERGIGVGVHYPAIHELSLYRDLGYGERSYPNAERIGRGTVTLPLFPGMADVDVERVCRAAAEVLAEASAQGRA
jgi:dTDP-4-amino-4,6-dideoxygalactose transaminase